jgi:hypothetical protein
MSHSPLACQVMEKNFQSNPLAFRLYSEQSRTSLTQLIDDMEELNQKIQELKTKVMQAVVINAEKVQK